MKLPAGLWRFLGLLAAGVALARPVVTKVEPPNWWPDHSLNPIRVLVHGTGLRGATLVPAKGLTASRIAVNEAGTYLFADISIPVGSAPGDYPFEVRTPEGIATAPFRLDAPLSPAGRFQGFSADDVIYLIMPDRFADGDPSNDNPAVSPGLFDRKNSRYYHGGDLQGIIDHLPYLKSLGVTALWITPIYDNANKLNELQTVNGHAVTDYHGYGTVDYYGVEEHFGSLALLRKLVDEAHRSGLKVIQDQVANHVSPNHPWVSDPPKPTWFHGTRAHHLNETWQIWALPDPNASRELERPVLDGWFADVLPDLDQEDPDVARYEIQNSLWWIGTAGFDGIREDTLPYVPRSFWQEWSAALKRQYPQLRVVGEVFDGDPAVPSFFQGGVKRFDGIDSGIDTVFDFPTYDNIRAVFAKGDNIDACAKTFAKDWLYPDAGRLVTFLGLHDVRRFMSEPGATVKKLELAFTFLMTIRGTPMIYYGDEIGIEGGDDPDNRRDFPGGWRDDPRNAFEASGRTSDENAIFDHVETLTRLRSEFEPLRWGKLVTLDATNKTLVYERTDGAGTAIIAINNGTEDTDITIHAQHDGEFRSEVGVTGDLRIRNGEALIHLPALSGEIYTSLPRQQLSTGAVR